MKVFAGTDSESKYDCCVLEVIISIIPVLVLRHNFFNAVIGEKPKFLNSIIFGNTNANMPNCNWKLNK
jgi:hypothetical protein